MSAPRLTQARTGGAISLPAAGRLAVFEPPVGADLSMLPAARVQIITADCRAHDHFAARGLDTVTAASGRYAASVVCVPRAKPLARALVARAAQVTEDLIIADGAKTDGIESLLKDVRARAAVSPPFSKAHGKIFSFAPSGAFADWAAAEHEIANGFVTRPGVFSAGGIDAGSAMLAAHLPRHLGARVADLGAGWGYLGRAVLEREGLIALHLVEANNEALECARQNVRDPLVLFHWADATQWRPDVALDAVVMNPPFHTGRNADPDLGRAFIKAAAAMLGPGGELWMVANRHLLYEADLDAAFARSEEVAGDARFKILHAARPISARRKGRQARPGP